MTAIICGQHAAAALPAAALACLALVLNITQIISCMPLVAAVKAVCSHAEACVYACAATCCYEAV
jgi:hypothetical protein